MRATFEPSQFDRERYSLLPRKPRSSLGDESCQVACWVITSLPGSRRRQPYTLWIRMPLNRAASVRCWRYQRRSSRQRQRRESNRAGRLGEREADVGPSARSCRSTTTWSSASLAKSSASAPLLRAATKIPITSSPVSSSHPCAFARELYESATEFGGGVGPRACGSTTGRYLPGVGSTNGPT